MVEYSVLIIDDDIWMQRILSKTLQSYGFKNVLMSSNGFEGIALAVEHRPALIILDILMPELSGHLTLKILKHIKFTKDIPVLMVSALSDIENLGLAVKSGTAGFISKPFTRATVYDKLVSIYGKEELELIMRGEPISGMESGQHRERLARGRIRRRKCSGF
jgi:two-component system, OmpR family, alkaline phosphatase synthesis response regulator PhoP